MKAINPATEEVIRDYPEHSPADVAQILAAVHRAYLDWRRRPFAERARLMHGAADGLRQRRDEHAACITEEMGKPLAQARGEVDKCAWVCDFYAENAEEMLRPEEADSGGSRAMVVHEPLGPVLAVMPWNFPFWQVFRFAAPALMAGNVGLLKHASNVPGSALAIEAVFKEAGFPDDTFRTLLIGARHVEAVIRDDRVMAVTLTGSEKAGSLVASQAASEIKKSVLELGGSDPFIVLDDADLEATCVQAIRGRMLNAGQSCIAAKRFIVAETICDAFTTRCVELMKNQKVGDPRDGSVDVGPLARGEFVSDIDSLVQDAVAAGARVRCGGHPVDGPGFFYAPTILSDVKPSMRIFLEETFGPVMVIYPVAGVEDAVELANATPFGLGASIWTRDTDRGIDIAHRIDAGAVFINGIVASDPRLPFGGVKRSGFGRELSHHGIKEFVNVKTIWVA